MGRKRKPRIWTDENIERKHRREIYGHGNGGARANPKISPDFGNGEVGGDNRWAPPVYGNTEDGEDVTVMFGMQSRENHTGIASGHTSGEEFFHTNERGHNDSHDHYGPNGESYRAIGRYED